jgi:DNA invertase Pin-like site-specific DNA recombinase
MVTGEGRMKVAIYCRVSTDKQELEQQIESCKRFCDFKQFEYEVFDEVGSGKDFKRIKFLNMLDRIRKREFQGVVVFRFDRLGRNTREVVTLFEEFESKGIQVFSIMENIDTTTPTGKAVRDIIIRLAQLERENISEATKQRLQALKNMGKSLGRPKGSSDKKKRKNEGYKARFKTGDEKLPSIYT